MIGNQAYGYWSSADHAKLTAARNQVNHIFGNVASSFSPIRPSVMLMASKSELETKTMNPSDRRFKVEVNPKLCKGCYFCIQYCPRGVFAKSESIGELGYVVAKVQHPEKCTGCRLCLLYCPDFAVSIEEQGDDEK